MIHITDSQTDKILSVINLGMFWGDKHKKSLKDNLETFDFDTFTDKAFSEHLAKRNRIIIPDEDGKYIEFIIENTHKRGDRIVTVYSMASYVELAKAKVIYPQTLGGQTSATATEFALLGTEWQPGIIEFKGIRTFNIEEHTNPFSFLKRIASEFGLELWFRVEIDGNRVVGRFVDLVERIGDWQGREVEFGKDLVGIDRKENNANIVTALVGLGPTREDGTRLEVYVEDLDALKRWGRNAQHLIETYEPQSTDQDMTIERLTTLTQNELEKRVNSVVEYTAEVADLEHVPGLENKRIRFGDTIKIKDTYFSPPLYLEARVHTQERSISDKSQKKVILGDYIEYTEDQVKAIWKSLQAEIALKISMTDVLEVTYTKTVIDGKDSSVLQDGMIYADGVSDTAKQVAISTASQDATDKANVAEANAKSHADNVASEALNSAIDYTEVHAEKKIFRGTQQPANPEIGAFWLDENESPGLWKKWGGDSWEKITRDTFEDLKGMLKSEQIPDGAITEAKIALESINSEHIKDLSITDTKLAAGTVTEAKMKWSTHLIF